MTKEEIAKFKEALKACLKKDEGKEKACQPITMYRLHLDPDSNKL